VEFFTSRSILTLTEQSGLTILSDAPEKKPDSQKSESGFSEEGDEKR
jgi:hypothetical protein